MSILHAIAAMSENRVIGDHGKIPWHLSEDFRWFKHKTMGGTLVMGRKTFDSIGKPLPGRKTVVVSRNLDRVSGGEAYSNLQVLLAAESSTPKIWVCGGAEIYRQLLPQCSVLYLTRVKRVVEGTRSCRLSRMSSLFTKSSTRRRISSRVLAHAQQSHLSNESKRESWPFPTS